MGAKAGNAMGSAGNLAGCKLRAAQAASRRED